MVSFAWFLELMLASFFARPRKVSLKSRGEPLHLFCVSRLCQRKGHMAMVSFAWFAFCCSLSRLVFPACPRKPSL